MVTYRLQEAKLPAFLRCVKFSLLSFRLPPGAGVVIVLTSATSVQWRAHFASGTSIADAVEHTYPVSVTPAALQTALLGKVESEHSSCAGRLRAAL